jgi:hypothetical protein
MSRRRAATVYSVLTQRQEGQLTVTCAICRRSYEEHTFRPDFPISEGFSE